MAIRFMWRSPGATRSRDVCLEQIRALDLSVPARSARKLGAFLDEATMTRVLDGLGAIFGI